MRRPDVGSVTRWPTIRDSTPEKIRIPSRRGAEERKPVAVVGEEASSA